MAVLRVALTALFLGACGGNNDGANAGNNDGGNAGAGMTCVAIGNIPVTGDVFEQNGAKITPDSVDLSVDGIQRGSCEVPFATLSYGCGDFGVGKYDITVVVQGRSMTKSVTFDATTSGGCFVAGSEKVDFTFDVSQSDAAPLSDAGPLDNG